jgi:exodeoxyribonuclease V alpha subunit
MSTLDRWLREGWLRAVDHALGTTLQRLRADTPDAVALAAALASRALEFGHSGVPLAEVASLFVEIDAQAPPPALPALEEWRAALLVSPFVGDGSDEARGRPLVFERDRIALRRYWHYELRLARALRTLAGPLQSAAEADSLQQRLRALFEPSGDVDRQALAAFVAQRERLLLLTGGPGTGKTTTIARVLALRAEHALHIGVPLRIALVAPTGKAAARLSEALRENLARLHADARISDAVVAALPTSASTLHRLLGWQPRSIAFRHDAAHPLPIDLLVVDEASMVDLPLMCKMVEALAPTAGLILLGDRDQLPSVETGDVLAALCDASGDGLALPPLLARDASAALGVTLPERASESILVRVELARSYRQSAALDLAPLAASVRNGDAQSALAGLHAQAYRGVDWQHGGDAALHAFVLERALPHYRAVAAAPDVAAALALARQFRVLTAVRDGAAGNLALNAGIALALQAPAARDDAFFPGRLVMIRENSYRHGLYNGDIGVCWHDGEGNVRVWFELDGAARAWLPATLPRHESAFALTVHKAQGSEFDDVLFVLPERGARVLSRELIYTGLTRARRVLTLWANEAVLAEAIARRAQRWSGVADRLRGA